MTGSTIGAGQTVAPGGEGTLLAGRYRVVRQLGQGGMGSVWLAEDTQLDNKPFAIKMLPAILVANKRAYRQLKDEALVAMRLVHPNIVQIRAFEENDGNPFLVMDYVDGQTLDDYLAEKGKLSGDETIRLLKPIAAALDYAHAKGVVHRDVKPGNVMIAKDGTPCILDFGIAREIQETMTRVTGKLSSGTLLYMSPEQLNGEQPRPPQDVYSFAAMAYECLKGEPPFARGQIEHQILNNPPPPLPDGMSLSASIIRGLSKTPEYRPDSCVKVLLSASSIRQIPSARPQVAVSPRPSAPVADRVVTRQKCNIAGIAIPLSCLIAALLVLGGVLWHREAQRQENARKLAVKQQQEEARRRQAEDERKEQEAAARKKAEVERKAKEDAERRKKVEEERLASERRAKDSATEIRIEAKVQQGKVARISDADGFKARKDSLEDVFIRAEAFYDENAKRWAEAEALYRDYIEKSKSLISFDGERQRAVAKRIEVQASFKKAEAVGAKTYAKDSWDAAVKTWNVAAAEFKRMEFAAAAETFSNALREFDDCAIEARNNKRIADEKLAEEKRLAEARAAEERHRAELARQAEERRRQEERRKAMQSLPGKWECSTVLSGYGYRITLNYEYYFLPNGDFKGRKTVPSASGDTVTTEEGRWTLSGNILTIQRTGSISTLPKALRSPLSSGRVTNEGYATEHNVLWRNDGRFELRLVGLVHPNDVKYNVQRSIRHDSDGKEIIHVKIEGGFLRPSSEHSTTETAKIFRRVPN